jgi:hypothetical protein
MEIMAFIWIDHCRRKIEFMPAEAIADGTNFQMQDKFFVNLPRIKSSHVILSGVDGSRSEASTPLKAPCYRQSA